MRSWLALGVIEAAFHADEFAEDELLAVELLGGLRTRREETEEEKGFENHVPRPGSAAHKIPTRSASKSWHRQASRGAPNKNMEMRKGSSTDRVKSTLQEQAVLNRTFGKRPLEGSKVGKGRRKRIVGGKDMIKKT